MKSVEKLTSEQIVSKISEDRAKYDMAQLRDVILIAEDTGFTVNQSKKLAPLLLNFAKRYRDSSDLRDADIVWSAIRTGGSMLTLDTVHLLSPLLDSGHLIETNLVAVKMLGRIFEVQPPGDIDQYTDLSRKVCQIAESKYNVVTGGFFIFTLTAMISSETKHIVKFLLDKDKCQFKSMIIHRLRDLQKTWKNHKVTNRAYELLKEVIDQVSS